MQLVKIQRLYRLWNMETLAHLHSLIKFSISYILEVLAIPGGNSHRYDYTLDNAKYLVIMKSDPKGH